ncbi:permease [uncultured Litoreibacter sp.]|uniref:permease n=1 Tax=uncultured Litoreibacter sp. TaxID=1392394 RepID=UPI0026115E0E|nr:permease [uncultured Litoreibacter sp.]
MADLTQTPASFAWWRSLPKAWLVIAAIPLALAAFDPAQLWPTLTFTAEAFGHTAIFIAFAVLAIGYLKASGAEAVVAKAFQGRETRMILLAAVLGGVSPFCSCEVIPFIAALLVAGAPLSAVMAFWLASPLMDPAMFLITSGTLGFEFALAKTLSAIGLGLFGGFMVKAFAATPVFVDPLRPASAGGGCGCGSPFKGAPVWRFWSEEPRRAVFKETSLENALFLGKWLLLAYLLESLMLTYVPADWIGTFLGGNGIGPIVLGALVGAPAYLNGYAAVPLVDALLAQGMSNGAAMSFMLAGGVSCIPAAVAVWALVKPRVFSAYLGFAFVGSVIAGLIWNVVA